MQNEEIDRLRNKAVNEINSLRGTLWNLRAEIMNTDNCRNCRVKRDILEISQNDGD